MSGSSSANKRAARKGAARKGAAAPNAAKNTGANGSLEDALRALNAKLISRLRASEEANHAAASAKGVAQQSLLAAQRARKNAETVVSTLSDDKKRLQHRVQEALNRCVALDNTVAELNEDGAKLKSQLHVEMQLVHDLKQQLKCELEEKQRLEMRVHTLERLLLGSKSTPEQSVQLSSVSSEISSEHSCSSSSVHATHENGALEHHLVPDKQPQPLEDDSIVTTPLSPPHGNLCAVVMQRVWTLITSLWHRLVSVIQGCTQSASRREETRPLLRA